MSTDNNALASEGNIASVPRTYFNEFLKQIEKYDLKIVFDGFGSHAKADALLRDLLKRAKEVFGPLAAKLETPTTWVAKNWGQGGDYGYEFENPQGAQTAARCPRILKSLTNPPGNADPFKWFYSSSHWHVNMMGKNPGGGIKSVLSANSNWENPNWQEYQNKTNNAIDLIAQFEPDQNNCMDHWDKSIKDSNWTEYADLSVLFHLVWPQFFPVHYKTTKDGYSQIEGMKRLLLDMALKFGVKLRPLKLTQQYSDYAAAYRVLLAIYDAFVYEDVTKPRPTPHFDFLTELLAEREDVEAEQLLLMKKALVIYGIPGTGKTHFAQKELRPPLFDADKVHRVQFHAGYSYADFMIGIRPQTNNGAITYKVEPGLLYRLAVEAANALLKPEAADCGDGATEADECKDLHQPPRYALLIDEINRADLARVFGEVLYCIEYRGKGGKDNSGKDITIKLPHLLKSDSDTTFSDPFQGGEKFYLPENLYIVGTMNQADRSIGAFDAALRRRFAWYKLDFSVSRLQQMLEEKLQQMLEEKGKFLLSCSLPAAAAAAVQAFIGRANGLNKMIAEGRSNDKDGKHALPLSDEHRIGHTWFAEIVGIMKSVGHQDGKISTLHLERLWLYFLHPQLEDALGFEAANYSAKLNNLRDFFTKAL